MQYYQNLEIVRKKAKATQKTIADLLNTTQQQYSKYEKGHQELPIRHLITLAKFYNISTDEVLGLNSVNMILNEDDKNLLKIYHKLSERRKGKIELFIEQLEEQQDEENAKNK